MADEREQEMLELMRECSRLLRQCQNTLNEVWSEWTRTHRSTVMKDVPVTKSVKRVLR